MKTPVTTYCDANVVDDGNFASTLILKCCIESTERPEVEWNFDIKDMAKADRVTANVEMVSQNNFVAIMRLKNIRDGDAGLYEAKIRNARGASRLKSRVRLLGFSRPRFLMRPRMVKHPQENVIRLEFASTNCFYKTASVLWTYNDVVLKDSEKYKIVTIHHRKENGDTYFALIINNVGVNTDKGFYRCIVKNKGAELFANFDLQLQPQQAPTQVAPVSVDFKYDGTRDYENCEVVVTMKVKFLCLTPYEITWMTDDDEPVDSAKHKATTENADWGIYYALLEFRKADIVDGEPPLRLKCKVSNMFGSFVAPATIKWEALK